MNEQEIAFMHALKQISLNQAKHLIGLVELAYEGSVNPPKIAKKQLRLLTSIGEAVQSRFPKRVGKMINPNSKQHRVFAALKQCINQSPASFKSLKADIKRMVPDISDGTLATYMFACKGIIKKNQIWYLDGDFQQQAA